MKRGNLRERPGPRISHAQNARVRERSFLVQIDGSWGAGKSTLLRFLSDSVKGEHGVQVQGKHWLVVTYDSCRQSEGGSPWLTLLQAIRTAVRLDQSRTWERVWFWLRERARLVSSWQWIAALFMLATTTLVTLVILSSGAESSVTKWGDVAKITGGLVPVVAAFWLLAGTAGRFCVPGLPSLRAGLS